MDSPLTKPDIAKLRRAANLAADGIIKCQLATQAGVDVSEHAVRCDHLSKSVQQMLTVFEPLLRTQGNKNGT